MTTHKPPRQASSAGTSARRGARAPGRPSGEGGDIRDRLLDAATRRFAAQGIGGTSLRDIANEAGVTPALVHYYFGGRDALLAAVIEERVMPLIQGLRAPVQQAGDNLRALIDGFVRTVIATASANPWLPQLWVREVLHEGGALRDLMLDRVGPLLPRMLAARFAEAQRVGQLNPRVDARLLVASIMGQTMFLVASAPVWRRLFDADDIDTDALVRHVLALLESGLEMPDA
ncbi:MAG: TetR/AcrR family transcriptional regulator [Xanthomonadaceae bacterium]|nr:TetR/AcrR family transcriptional regulator [Xanthomonadaceae bacterium]